MIRKNLVDTVKDSIYAQSTGESYSRTLRLSYDDVDTIAAKIADYAEEAEANKKPKRIGIVHMAFFSTPAELSALTGLPYEELWKHGFDIDDMDFGFQVDVALDDDREYFEHWLIERIADDFAHYCVVEYAGRYYYTVHHS